MALQQGQPLEGELGGLFFECINCCYPLEDMPI